MKQVLRYFTGLIVLTMLISAAPFSPASAAEGARVWQFDGDELHSVALRDNGEVWIWGLSSDNELGIPGLKETAVPKQVLIKDVKKISAAFLTTVALKKDGTVWGWGGNRFLGLGASPLAGSFYQSVAKPRQISGLQNIVDIAAGKFHTLALKSDGTVLALGRNNEGQLGIGKNSVQFGKDDVYATPQPVKNLKNIVAVEAGDQYSLALDKNGNVWLWGGIMLDGTFTQIGGWNTPRKINGLSGITQLSAGPMHFLALKSDGTVWAMGSGAHNQLGDGKERDFKNPATAPVQVKGLTDAAQIAAGYGHSLALKKDGTLWSWGSNDVGQLGLDTFSALPAQIQDLEGIVSIDASADRSYAVRKDGSAWAIGSNGYGLLGNGLNQDSSKPVQVKLPGQPVIGLYQMQKTKMMELRVKGQSNAIPGAESFINEKGVLMLPATLVEQLLGATLVWMKEPKSAVMMYKQNFYQIRAGEKMSFYSLASFDVEDKPAVVDGKLYIPVSFFEQFAQATIEYPQSEPNVVTLAIPDHSVDKSFKAGVDFWGRNLRTSNLPKNAGSFPYLLQDLPNAMYEQPFVYRIKSQLIPPSQWFATSSMAQKSNIDFWVQRITDCYSMILNVDYQANNQGWAAKLFTQRSGVAQASAIKANQEYINWVKKNEIQIEGSIVPEASMVYSSDEGLLIRTKVKFRLKHFKEYKDLLYDRFFDSSSTQKFKKNVWYEAYVDIPMISNVFDGDGRSYHVDPSASLFLHMNSAVTFKEVK